MGSRIGMVLAGLLLLPAAVPAQDAPVPRLPSVVSPTVPPTPRPAATRPPQPPRPLRQPTSPFAIPLPPPAPPVVSDLAPMPNRDIEAPPDRFGSRRGPVLEPAFLEHRERSRGFTFDRELPADRQDRRFNDVAPGARLRIPLD
jgi:hypothetical protein